MTVLVGARTGEGGAILYADRNVVASDGTRIEGTKIWSIDTPQGGIAIGSATDDAVASESLAREILGDFHHSYPADFTDLIERSRDHLRRWNEPYPEELSITYLMAACVAGTVNLYLLQPRNKVLLIPQRYVTGSGATATEQLLEDLLPDGHYFLPEATMMRLAYLVRHAKDRIALVGGGSNAIYIPTIGSPRWIDSIQLSTAEGMAVFVDETLRMVTGLLLSLTSHDDAAAATKLLTNMIITTADSLRNGVKFTALQPPTASL